MNAKQYIREIIQRTCLPSRERKRLRQDLENDIETALERGESIEQIIERMGEPDKIAAELYENYTGSPVRPFREYKSKKTLFGLPLVHIIRLNHAAAVPLIRAAGARGINIGGRYGCMPAIGLPTAKGVFAFGPKAKGIISIGNFSAGIISIGNFSAGIVSIGNISAGLLALGNMVLALLLSFGNIAAGALSAGNIALGLGVAGNVALGRYAIGNEVWGAFTFKVSDLNSQLEAVRQFIGGLSAPAPVRSFYGFIDRIITVLSDPMAALPYTIAFLSVLAVVAAVIYIAVGRLLRKNENPWER